MRILAVTNMYPTREHPAAGTFVEQQVKGLKELGLEVEVLLVDRLGKGPMAYCGLKARVARVIAQARFDVIHAMYGGVMARAVAQLARQPPAVVSICGSDLLGTPGPWPVAWLRSWLNSAASIRACERADGVVVKSKNLARALPETVDKAKVRVIPNGIDTALFRPMDRSACLRRLGWAGDAFHLLFPLSGHQVTKRLPLAVQSADLARALGLPVAFHALRGIPHSEVPVWLNASNVLLLTSFHEGSPNIVKEALACNTPVVSVDVGDVAERIGEIEGCHLVPPDAELIALKLQAVAARGKRVEGRAWVLQLSLRNVAQQLKDFYSLLLEHRFALDTVACAA